MNAWNAIAWAAVIVGAVWTGMVTRIFGQFLLDWAKSPWDAIKSEKDRKAKLSALLKTIRNAAQYCQQIDKGLKGVPVGPPTAANLNEALKRAAIKMGVYTVVPTFNLDTGMLEAIVPSVYSILDEAKGDQILTTRLEIRHLARRVDVITDKLSFIDADDISDQHYDYAIGTQQLIASTIRHCNESIEMLEKEIASSRSPAYPYWPSILVGVVVIALVVGFVWASWYLLKQGISITIGNQGAS